MLWKNTAIVLCMLWVCGCLCGLGEWCIQLYCACACEGQRSKLKVLLNLSMPQFLMEVSHWLVALGDLARISGRQQEGSSWFWLLSVLELKGVLLNISLGASQPPKIPLYGIQSLNVGLAFSVTILWNLSSPGTVLLAISHGLFPLWLHPVNR